ncbi:MAG: prolipoprotein diacylglyceryl transferase, partial [Planctomycetota bacterium]
MTLAEIPYPRLHPEIFSVGPVTVRWYGLSYVVAFILAFLVLRNLAKRGRWPVESERVADVLFWGILGVFVGGRLGWILFYGLSTPGYDWTRFWRVWEGGMSFHGGLLGVIIAYWIYLWRTRKPVGAFFDGLTLATPLGIFCVRMGNFINGELFGRPWDGAWAMRFPKYGNFEGGASEWEAKQGTLSQSQLWTEPRHPSQLYEALGE